VSAAALSAVIGVPVRVTFIALLLAVLAASHWAGRMSGVVATVASVIAAGVLLASQSGAFPTPIDLATLALIALAGSLIAVWTGAAADRPAVAPGDTGRLKEEFLATVSHELRTPLNAILGWVELLRTPSVLPPHEINRGLEVIERNARRQLALVEELLAVADPAGSAADWQRVDLHALMHTLLEHLAEPARAAHVALQEEPAAGPPGAAGEGAVWVLGDPAGLRLALRHILENALKFTPAGGRVRTRLARRGGNALIAVSDTGQGIDPAIGERVFDPFRQHDSSASRSHGGLGLGLTIARRLIEAHGGRVDVRSEGPGQGATFLVTLPRASGDPVRQSP